MLNNLRKRVVHTIASRHIAGREIGDALRVCRWAQTNAYRVILSPWRSPDDSAKNMIARYKEAMRVISDERLDGYVSLKLNAIDSDMGMFRELVSMARSANVRLHLDSLGPDSANASFEFLEDAVSDYRNIGTTLPARWRRSLEDADRVYELGIPVRIVKGQWPDLDDPRLDCRKNYLDIAHRFAGRGIHVGIATHDYSLASRTSSLFKESGTSFELEQFFSLPLNTSSLANRIGCGYRLYVAYGYPEVPYNVRFGISRPGIIGWVVKDFAVRNRKPWEKSPSSIHEVADTTDRTVS